MCLKKPVDATVLGIVLPVRFANGRWPVMAGGPLLTTRPTRQRSSYLHTHTCVGVTYFSLSGEYSMS